MSIDNFEKTIRFSIAASERKVEDKKKTNI